VRPGRRRSLQPVAAPGEGLGEEKRSALTRVLRPLPTDRACCMAASRRSRRSRQLVQQGKIRVPHDVSDRELRPAPAVRRMARRRSRPTTVELPLATSAGSGADGA
jgi:hypothetical protein